MWEILIFWIGDWFVFGEPFFCGLFIVISHDDEGYNFADEEESHSRRDAGSRATARTSPAAAKFEVDDDDEYAAFADRRDEEEGPTTTEC